MTSLSFGLILVGACVPNDDKAKGEPQPDSLRPRVAAPATRADAGSTLFPTGAARHSAFVDGSPGPALRAQAGERALDAGPRVERPILRKPFKDDFERAELGADWLATTSQWQIRSGQLCGSSAYNHPVWLTYRLPTNARIEFDAVTRSPSGDIKAELWGDGQSAATSVSYTNASSYLTIFGGWKNHYHVLARINEHAPDRPEVRLDENSSDFRARPVRPDQNYHFKVERSNGKTVRWSVDDIEILSFTDPSPLKGRGHEYFGFNDWEVPLCFDNFTITPLLGD